LQDQGKRTRRARKASRLSSHLTVMFVKGQGRVRSVNISARILLIASLFFLLYIVGSLIVINDYFDKRRNTAVLLNRISQLNVQVEDSTKALEKSRKQLALLEKSIEDMETQAEDQAEMAGTGTENRDATVSKETASSGSDKLSPQEPVVGIADMAFRDEEGKFIVTFKLLNLFKDERAVSGYVHTLALEKNADPPRIRTFPSVGLQDGVPVNYKRGQLFLIKRFRTIHAEYPLEAKTESPSSIVVLVYDRSGTLLLRKEFEVGHNP